MELGETIATYDVDLALRGETGKFEVTSPAGEIYYLTCKPDQTLTKAGAKLVPPPSHAFLIRKIAEPVSMDPRAALPGFTAKQEVEVPSPFLVDGGTTAKKSSVEKILLSTDVRSEVWSFELSYSEDDSNKATPSAMVLVREAKTQDSETRRMITVPCGSFNELDSEIRRLHAQLEEICLRAKKRFYKAYAAASA